MDPGHYEEAKIDVVNDTLIVTNYEDKEMYNYNLLTKEHPE